MRHEPENSRFSSTRISSPEAQCCPTGKHDSAESILTSLALTIEARDPQTSGHCRRLARYAIAVGLALRLSEADVNTLRRGSIVHDIGKVGIPDAILLKPGPLTETEYQRMKAHTTIGDTLCVGLQSLTGVRQIIRSHHERLDGSGYPDGLKGEEIPQLAQIVGLIDAFDALTTTRPYKPPLPPERAFEELLTDAQKGWRQRDLVDRFVALGRRGLLDMSDYTRSDR